VQQYLPHDIREAFLVTPDIFDEFSFQSFYETGSFSLRDLMKKRASDGIFFYKREEEIQFIAS
jgi:hypothetical protein